MNALDPRLPVALFPALGFGLLALGLFHAGYLVPGGWPMLAFPFALLALVRLPSPRSAFYSGLALGVALYAPHLGFFWTIFGPPAFLLWLILGFWIAAFLGVGQSLWRRLPRPSLILLLPILWTGFEFFRSELYFLRFSWLSPAMALVNPPSTPPLNAALHALGGYGTGFVLVLSASLGWFATGPWRWSGVALPSVVALSIALLAPTSPSVTAPARTIEFAGAQIENVAESDIVPVLDRLARAHPDAPLLILPEYSLDGEPDAALREWCRAAGRHLVVGGRQPLEAGGFHNMTFVIDPKGDIVFRQAKSVPIQFFDDGIPATSQAVWASPWGRIGLAVCYDLSYTRVMDGLIRLGAEALIIPTMDAISWGAYQHALHSRVAPLRAAEYGIPIARVASSGISQCVAASGRVTASAPFSDEVEFVHGTLEFRGSGTLPLDRFLLPFAVTATAILILGATLPLNLVRRFTSRNPPAHNG